MSLLEAQISMRLRRHIFNYIDKCSGYAHPHIAEVCKSFVTNIPPSATEILEGPLKSKNLFAIGESKAVLSLASLICSDTARTSLKVLKHQFCNAQRWSPVMKK